MKLSGLLAKFSSSSLSFLILFLLHIHFLLNFFSSFIFVPCFPYSSSVFSTFSILLSCSLCSYLLPHRPYLIILLHSLQFSFLLLSFLFLFILQFSSALYPLPAYSSHISPSVFSLLHILSFFTSFDFLNFFLYSSASASIRYSSSYYYSCSQILR
jgi:hypothetical protein